VPETLPSDLLRLHQSLTNFCLQVPISNHIQGSFLLSEVRRAPSASPVGTSKKGSVQTTLRRAPELPTCANSVLVNENNLLLILRTRLASVWIEEH